MRPIFPVEFQLYIIANESHSQATLSRRTSFVKRYTKISLMVNKSTESLLSYKIGSSYGNAPWCEEVFGYSGGSRGGGPGGQDPLKLENWTPVCPPPFLLVNLIWTPPPLSKILDPPLGYHATRFPDSVSSGASDKPPSDKCPFLV